MNCDIGYVNCDNISSYELADSVYAALHNSPAIIVDLRGASDSDGGTPELAYDMASTYTSAHEQTIPDGTYPGAFYWYYDSVGPYNSTLPPYDGTIIILFNEQSQSHTEYYCMHFSALSATNNVVKIGSQTAGADGVITYFPLTQDIVTGFSGSGVFYPNGDSTQRIGIVPDIVARPTIRGIIEGRDEVLEEALQVACSLTSVPKINSSQNGLRVYPNPAQDQITVTIGSGALIRTIKVVDVIGQTVREVNNSAGNTATIDVSHLAAGMYFVNVSTATGEYCAKFVKE